jgi:hypothetical protein
MFRSYSARSRQDALLLHEDAKKVLPKMGGKRPGKKCKGSYISADKKCSDHSTTTGSGKRKLSEAGKKAAMELAAKVRKRKGMGDRAKAVAGKEMDKPKRQLKSKKEFESQAKSLSPLVAGVVIDDKSISRHPVTIKGVKVLDIVGSKQRYFLGADAVYTRNGVERKVSDPTMARNLYTRAMGLPKDSIVGGSMRVYEMEKGSAGPTTQSGTMLTAGRAKKRQIDLGIQAMDFA